MTKLIDVIILTGPDGVGKSSVKKYLEKKLNYSCFVLDRFFDSYVYGKIFKRDNPTRQQILYFIQRFSKICNAYTIILTADKTQLSWRLFSKGEKEDQDFLEKSIKGFEELYYRIESKVLLLDTNKLSMEQVGNRIIEFVKKEGKK